MASYQPLVLGGLAKYENRMGLVHVRISSYRGDSTAVRSKDTLVLVQVRTHNLSVLIRSQQEMRLNRL